MATGVSEIFGNEEEVNRKAVDLVLWRKPVNVTCRSICILKNENSTDMTGLNTEVHRRKKKLLILDCSFSYHINKTKG